MEQNVPDGTWKKFMKQVKIVNGIKSILVFK